MTKGKRLSLTPLALALGLALSVQAVAGEKIIDSSTAFDTDTTYIVDDQPYVVGGNRTNTPVEAVSYTHLTLPTNSLV